MVPGHTHGYAVLCVDPRVQGGFEVKLRAGGRITLGARRQTLKEGLKGDMGWTSSFWGKLLRQRNLVARQNLKRPRRVNRQGWAGKVFSYLYTKGLLSNKGWNRRSTERLNPNYSTSNEEINELKMTKKTVKKAHRMQWVNMMQVKPALEMCSELGGASRRKIFTATQGASHYIWGEVGGFKD